MTPRRAVQWVPSLKLRLTSSNLPEKIWTITINSVVRAREAIENKFLEAEIEPILVGESRITDDEQPGRAKLEKISSLRPAFKADGTITAANSSSISDGASSLVLTSDAHNLTVEPLGTIVGHCTHSIHPSDFTIAPVGAIQKLPTKIDWKIDDVELFEINEAFAMVTMLAIQEQLRPS